MGGFELIGSSENLQTLLGGLGPPQFVRVEEFLPATLARFNQTLRGGKLDDEVPRERRRPIFKSLQGSGIILQEGLLQLVNQERPLLDESHLMLLGGLGPPPSL